MKKSHQQPKKISLDFGRLSGDHVRAIAEGTVGDIEEPKKAAQSDPSPPSAPEEPKKPFEGMYYPLGR